MRVPQTIAIEFETIGDSRSMFRLRVDGRVVGENLTAAQTHILVGDILEEIALPKMEWMVRREVGSARIIKVTRAPALEASSSLF